MPLGAALEKLPDSELLACLRAHERKSPEWAGACDVLVRRYTPLVRACVRQYLASPEPTEDLMQVGYLGLLKAIRNYDPAFGNGLRAYAVPCITGELKRHFRDKRWQVKVTRPVQELLLEMRDAVENLTHELGRPPGDGELAGRLGVTAEEVREARQAAGDGDVLVSVLVDERGGAAQRGRGAVVPVIHSRVGERVVRERGQGGSDQEPGRAGDDQRRGRGCGVRQRPSPRG